GFEAVFDGKGKNVSVHTQPTGLLSGFRPEEFDLVRPAPEKHMEPSFFQHRDIGVQPLAVDDEFSLAFRYFERYLVIDTYPVTCHLFAFGPLGRFNLSARIGPDLPPSAMPSREQRESRPGTCLHLPSHSPGPLRNRKNIPACPRRSIRTPGGVFRRVHEPWASRWGSGTAAGTRRGTAEAPQIPAPGILFSFPSGCRYQSRNCHRDAKIPRQSGSYAGFLPPSPKRRCCRDR